MGVPFAAQDFDPDPPAKASLLGRDGGIRTPVVRRIKRLIAES
jgi:hypothetical protein